MMSSPSEAPRDAVAGAWRGTVLSRLIADIDPCVWEWIVPSRVPTSRYEAFTEAAARHKRVALAAAERASELRMGKDDHRKRQRLYDRLRDALRCTDVGSVALGKDSNLLVLLVHWMGMTLEDLLPPRQKELRLPVAEARLVQKQINSMGMPERLKNYSPPETWSSDAAAFQRLAENHERVSLQYEEAAAGQQSHHHRRQQMLTRARRQNITLYSLAKLLARLGIPATDGDYAPSPTDRRYKTEGAFTDAYNDWVTVQHDRHYQILKAAAAAPRKAAAKRNKKMAVKAG